MTEPLHVYAGENLAVCGAEVGDPCPACGDPGLIDVERLARALFFAEVIKRPWDMSWMSSTDGRLFTHDLAAAIAAAYAGTPVEYDGAS